MSGHKDFLGKELMINDRVVVLRNTRNSGKLRKGVVSRFTEKMVFVTFGKSEEEHKTIGRQCVQYEEK